MSFTKYDWVLTFTAQNIMQAKKFCESLFALHPGVIEKTVLLETLFIVKNHHILNPEPKKKPEEPQPDPMVNSVDEQIRLLEIEQKLIWLRQQVKEKPKTDMYYQ